MITLTVDNSVSKIEGLTIEQYTAIRSLLSYQPPAIVHTRFMRPNPRKYLIGTKCEFPTGLLYLVQGWLKDNKIGYALNDIRRVCGAISTPFTLSMQVTPYPEQIEASKAAERAYRGIISQPTGSGKSLVAALIVERMQVRTLIVVPSLELKRQLTQTMVECFGEDRVGTRKDIWVENVDALDPRAKLNDYGCLILDEFHHSAATTYRKLNVRSWANIYYRFGLTATPFRTQDHERLLLESCLSKVIYELDYQTAVDKGYIVPVEAYYVDLPKKSQPPQGYTWAQVYNELVVNNEERNQVIANMITKLTNAGLSTLCLVKEIDHGQNLQRLLNITGVEFATGVDENTPYFIKDFNQGGKTLVGTTGVLGEGVDTKPAEYVIIAGLGKSRGQFMQQVGRGVRKYPGKTSAKVIIIRDQNHKWTINHFNEQRKILKQEYNVIPVKL